MDGIDYDISYDWLEDGGTATVNLTRPRIDTHLNSPIRSSYLELVRDSILLYPNRAYDPVKSSKRLPYVRLPKSCYEVAGSLIALFSESQEKAISSIIWDISPILGRVYASVYDKSAMPDPSMRPNSRELMNAIYKVMLEFDPRITKEMLPIPEIYFRPEEAAAYNVKIHLEKAKEATMALSEKNSSEWLLCPLFISGVPAVLIHRSMCIFVTGNIRVEKKRQMNSTILADILLQGGKLYAASYEHLLCIQDTYIARFFCLYATRIMAPTMLFKLSQDLLVYVYQTFDNGFHVYGNDIFRHIKLFEGLLHSLLIKECDTLSSRTRYLNVILNDARKLNSPFLPNIEHIMTGSTPQILSEIYGLYRHWGHPIIDEPAACQALHKIIETRSYPDPVTSKRVLGCLIRYFCISYIMRHSHWPTCNTDELPENSALPILIANNETRINLYQIEITLEEWGSLKVVDAIPFDPIDDYTQLLSDKSIAPLLSEEKSTYNPDMMGEYPKKPSTSRRLLTEIVSKHEFNTRDILVKVSTRTVPWEWYHIKLTPKEREVTIEARVYAMMPAEMRVFFCLLETNISKGLFPYYPQQSMNNSEEKLARRLINMSKTTKGQAMVEVTVGVDFTKWNMHWSMMNTQMFAEALDSIFGVLGLFTFGHEFFSQSIVSLNSAFHIPKEFMKGCPDAARNIPRGLYRWCHHLGGLEGIMQKFWTWITIGMLLLVEQETGISAEIVGQGDNQVCKLKIYVTEVKGATREELIRYHDTYILQEVDIFLRKLEEVTAAMGLKIKLMESWISDSVLNYGKQLFVRGACMPQLLKRLSRTLADVNENFPTINTRIGAIQSSGYSSAQKTYTVAIPYFISNLESMIAMSREIGPVCRKMKHAHLEYVCSITGLMYSEEFWIMVLLLPADLTTIPILNLLQYDFRGSPDDFTTYMTFLWELRNSGSDSPVNKCARRIWNAISSEKFGYGEGNCELLVTNPTCINYDVPDRPSNKFKKLVEDHLISHSRNRDIKKLFTLTSREEDKEYFKYLISATPVMPRFCEIIASNSVIGTKTYIISKFTLTKTLQYDAGVYGNLSSSDFIDECDAKTYAHLSQIYQTVMHENTDISSVGCPTTLAHTIRVASHAPILDGRDIVGITVPHPSHVVDIKYEDVSEGDGYISFLASRPIMQDDILIAGDQPSFVGSRTREKTSGRIVTVSTKSRPVQGACRISQIQKWVVDPGSELWTFLDNLVKQRTDTTPEFLRLVSGEVTAGSAHHRLGDAVVKKATANNFPHSFTTHFAFSSDKLLSATRGGDDYNIQPNAIVHHMYRDILTELMANPTKSITYARGYQVNDCCHAAHKHELIYSNMTPPPLKYDQTNKLVFSPIESYSEVFIPRSILIKRTKAVTQADAIAFYIVQRFKGNTSTNIISEADTKSPYLTKISLSDFYNTGVPSILQSLSKYLYIYLGGDIEQNREAILSLSVEGWCGLADAVLCPSLMPDLIQPSQIDGIVDAYQSRSAVARRLNELLYDMIMRISKRQSKITAFSNLVFFVTPNIKLLNILLMWNFKNFEVGHVPGILYHGIKELIYKSLKEKVSWNKIITDILNLIIDYDRKHCLENRTLQNILKNHQILLAEGPPESYFRQGETRPKQILMQKPAGVPSKDVRAALYEARYAIPPIICYRTPNSELVLASESPLPQTDLIQRLGYGRKSRLDQAYRLIGTLSTGYCKLAQMLIVEDIPMTKPAIALADGEGSMALYMHKTSGLPVTFNSKRPEKTITTQRYEHFVPGSFCLDRQGVIGSDICMIYAGDLTDDRYVSKLFERLPVEASIVTCDAEASGVLPNSTRLGIAYTTLRVCVASKASYVAIKAFMDNAPLCAMIISGMLCIYRSVRIVVPDYSSFESPECYLVGFDYNPLNTGFNEPEWRDGFIVEKDWRRHSITVCDLYVAKKSVGHPLLYRRIGLLPFYCKLGLEAGFHDNFKESVSKLLGCVYKEQLTPTNLLAELPGIIEDIKHTLARTITAYKITLTVQENKPVWNAAFPISGVNEISSKLTRLCEQVIAGEALTSILPYSDILQAHCAYQEYTTNPIITMTDDQKILFSYNMRFVCLEWESKYLKQVWRVWGHAILR